MDVLMLIANGWDFENYSMFKHTIPVLIGLCFIAISIIGLFYSIETDYMRIKKSKKLGKIPYIWR
jgi:hypothetical protein